MSSLGIFEIIFADFWSEDLDPEDDYAAAGEGDDDDDGVEDELNDDGDEWGREHYVDVG